MRIRSAQRRLLTDDATVKRWTHFLRGVHRESLSSIAASCLLADFDAHRGLGAALLLDDPSNSGRGVEAVRVIAGHSKLDATGEDVRAAVAKVGWSAPSSA